MKKITGSIIFACFLATSCTSVRYYADYEVNLTGVEKSSNGKKIEVGETSIKENCFSDSNLRVCFTPSKKDIGFTLVNLTDQNMKVVWDETVVTTLGKESKVLHEGVKFIDRNDFQRPSIVYPGKSLSDLVAPSENVYWRDGYYSQYGSSPGGWEQRPFFIDRNYTPSGAETLDSSSFVSYVENIKKAGNISINLPVVVGESNRKDYEFKFKVEDAKISPIEIQDSKKTSTASAVITTISTVLLLILVL